MSNHSVIATAQEAQKNPEYMQSLKELLYQIADDDFLLSYRGSEWLGLVPHIEEDVAYSSITQNTMGHAAIVYTLLAELGEEGNADDLAHLRKPGEYRNAVLVERANGSGDFNENPEYDWAYAVVRNLAYELFKRLRLVALTSSSYQPLAQTAEKILREQYYHLHHWQVWIDQLSNATEEATKRLNEALQKVWPDVDSLFDLGSEAESIVSQGLMPATNEIKEQWVSEMKKIVQACQLNWPGEIKSGAISGRNGDYSPEFTLALANLSEVYQSDPQAIW